MKKRKLLIPLLMAIVMMAMSPAKGWAVIDEPTFSTDQVTYSETGSKIVITFTESSYPCYWGTAPTLYIDGTATKLTLNNLWDDLTSPNSDKHSAGISNTELDKKTASILPSKGVNAIGTAKLQNHKSITGGYSIELHLTFDPEFFSFYGHEIKLEGKYGTQTSSYTTYMNGYTRPKSLQSTQSGSDINLSWEAETYNTNTNTNGSWYIYRSSTQLGSVPYGTTSFTDTEFTCNKSNNYKVVFVPTGWTAKSDINGLYASTSRYANHTYGDPSWTWSNDGKTATCSRACTNTSCTTSTTNHTASATVTLGNGITSVEDIPATCLTMGKTTYTAKATVAGSEYTDTKIVTDIAALGHTYGDPAWTWGDDYESAECTRTCTVCDEGTEGHKASADVTLGNGITYEVTTPAKCTESGKGKYTAAATVAGSEYSDYKDKDIPATGHTTPDNFDANGIKKCTVCGTDVEYQPLGKADADGWYSISNAGHLASFANKVNDGETDIKGRLANDIDMQGQTVVQIGADSEKPFHGELDGQYHAIKNLSINADAEYKASLIGYADKVTIQKLTVQGTINSSSKFATGFIGQTKNNPSKIEKCISAVNIIATINGDGTHAGFVGVASVKAELSDCAFVGSITSENGTNNCAALVGWDSSKSSSAQNCYVTATFTNGICQNPLMRNNSNEFSTCYYLNAFVNADGTPLTSVQGNQITAQQLTSGELCYLLNDEVNYKTDGTQAWYQKIGTDARPVLTAGTDNTVYCVYGSTCCDRTFNNTAGSGTPVHPYSSDNNKMKWTWADDYSSATVTYTCSSSDKHIPNVAATITSTVPLPATCTMMGRTKYTATVNISGTDYTDSKTVENLGVLDHNLTTTADDDIKSCTMCNKKDLSAIKVSVSQNSNAIETAQIENTDNPQVFQFVDGKVVMTLGEGTAHLAEMPLAEGAKMTIKGVTYNDETNKTSLSVSSAGYATFSSAFQLAVPDNEGIEFYAPVMNEDGNIFINNATKLAANTVVPAATGLLIKGNEGDYNVEYSSAEAPEVTSALTASVVARPVTDFSGNIFALGYNPTDGIGFYRFSGSTTDARKAFLLLPTGSSARIGFITDDVSTSISQPAIISLPTGRAGESLYNLAGQRVSHNTRGIIIVNGKKYINK